MGLFGSSKPAAAPEPGGKPAAAPEPAAPPSLEQSCQALLAARGSTDANALTNQLVQTILDFAVREGASDIHLEPNGDLLQVRFRIDGALYDRLTISKKDLPITSQLRVMAGFSPQAATAYTPEDGSFQTAAANRPVRFRASAFPTINGDKLVLRILDVGQTALRLESLGFFADTLEKLQAAIKSPSGILFVCGITGGGKTTTLCSILRTLTRPETNIVTLEDPVEYELPRVVQSNINPKAGFGFADGLRSILRQDPNVIMLGEVRDRETAEIAMRAALTGHLIFTTIHTISAVGVVSRLIDMGIEPFLIGNAMLGALAQRLVRRVCAQCAQPSVSPGLDAAVESLAKLLEPDEADFLRSMAATPGGGFLSAPGCPACNMTGYKGRVGIFELLIFNKELQALISAKADGSELRKAAIRAGMKTMMMDAVAKAWAGVTTLDEVGRIAGAR